MALLDRAIMSDNSLLFAFVENAGSITDLSAILPEEIKRIKVSKQIRQRKWLDFSYKNERFSIYADSGDLMFFAENIYCPKDVINALLQNFSFSYRE
jgi:hypothetical protein